MKYPLTLGAIKFDQGAFEGPDGNKGGLSDLGSKQKCVVKEFPGGIMTAQLYGSFPKVIKWSGKLFGSRAIDRSFELQTLCDNGEQIKLRWAAWSFDGFVEDFVTTVRGPNEIDYEITFRPLQSNSTSPGGNDPANQDPFSGTVSNAQNALTQQAATPANGGVLPATIPPAVATLNQSITSAVQLSGGSVVNIPAATSQNLQSQISGLTSQLAPIIKGSDPIASSAAADLNGTLSILNTAFKNSADQKITTLSVVNPNLYQLAQRYYSDPNLYWVIGNRNGLIDPMPVTNGAISLVIPILPPVIEPTNSTVLYGTSA